MLASLFDVSDQRKRSLLQAIGALKLEDGGLDTLLRAARVHCLSKIELYFLHDASELKAPLNLRNEAAAVSLLLAYFAEEGGTDGSKAALLEALLEYSQTLWPELTSGDTTLSNSGCRRRGGDGGLQQQQQRRQAPLGFPAPPGSAAADFEAWAREQGVQAAIRIASFGDLRGVAASRAVQPGEVVLSIPAEVLIYEDTVKGTDLGRMLLAIPDLTIDNLLIIFSMIDRHDEDSKWARYWRSLPDKYYTGLSFPQELVQELEGTAAHLELQRAQQHLRQQYAATQPLLDMLLTAYPQFLQPGWFDYDSYLWAAELWYSYAFEVEFPPEDQSANGGSSGSSGAPAAVKKNSGGSGCGSSKKGGKGGGRGGRRGGAQPISAPAAAAGAGAAADAEGSSGSSSSSSKPVMVPFACHINHSPWPHCVRYGKVNPRTRTLDYPAFRPCQEGQQVFISYGPVPNLKLLCYYGFVVAGNPHDLVLLQLEPPEGPLKQQQLRVLEAAGLGLEHNLQDGPLSKQLLACLRVIVATPEELQLISGGQADPLAGAINGENEEQALATLLAALLGMMEPLQQLPLLAPAGGAVDAAGVAEEVGGGGGGGAGEGSGGEATVAEQGAAAGQEQALPSQQQQEQQQEEAPSRQDQEADGQAAAGGQAAADEAQQRKPEGQPACNENGFDSDWRMSRHFCKVYLQGQLHIVQRSLQECRKLMHAA